MKRKYTIILLALIGFLGMSSVGTAQIRGEIKVTLPFEFVVDGKTLPAGAYTVSRFADDKYEGLILTNYEDRTSVFVHTVELESASAGKPQVSFERVGNSTSSAGFEHRTTSITFRYPARSFSRQPQEHRATCLPPKVPEPIRSFLFGVAGGNSGWTMNSCPCSLPTTFFRSRQMTSRANMFQN